MTIFPCLATAIAVALPLMAPADERLTGIACRSVHLAYDAPASAALFNEVTVQESAEGTYFCVIGFQVGYFGIQELADGGKVALFSVWDPGSENDPSQVPEARRVKVVSQGDGVRVKRFGNEGTGGQSFLDLDWAPGETYQFLVTAAPDPDGDDARTAFSAHVRKKGDEAWRPMATFSTITNRKTLGGFYSFIEDFRRNRVSTTKARRAVYGPAWARTPDGAWTPISSARFTADSNRATNIDAGVAADGPGRFFLATGGDTPEGASRLNQAIEVKPGIEPPAVEDAP